MFDAHKTYTRQYWYSVGQFFALLSVVLSLCSNFFVITVDGVSRWRLPTDHTYYHQIQGQLHVMGKHCCDLIVWTDVDMLVVRIAVDPLWAENLSKLTDFYFQKLIPQMLS